MNETFPADFLWGAATSAYQIEGAPLEDGAGPGIWHRFTHTPGNIAFGETGDVACDHYHRWPEDIALMRQLGLQSYRFGIAWARVLPEGTGRTNARGIGFYDRLVDELLAAGITPNVTLYHWDLPAALADRGGWLNPEIASWFGEYAELMYRALGDRIPMWATLNEPWVSVDAGYLHGVHAPGIRGLHEAWRAAHNLMRAHGTAVQAFRASGARGRIGLVVNLEPKYPATDEPLDLEAAFRTDAYMNRQYLDAALLGEYPAELRTIYGEGWREPTAADMSLIRQPLDFIGINYYKRGVTRHDDSAWPLRAAYVRQPQSPHTIIGWEWEVYPSALTRLLLWVHDRYGDIPLYITENGAAFYDPPSAVNGRIDDPLRIDYLREHLRAAHAAIRAGVNLRGYYVWSLLDNFEWSAGYTPRFGLVHVDFATLARTPKASAHFYADVIRSNGRSALAQEGSRHS